MDLMKPSHASNSDQMRVFAGTPIVGLPHLKCLAGQTASRCLTMAKRLHARIGSRISMYANVNVNLRSYAGYQVATPRKIRKTQFDHEADQILLTKDHVPANSVGVREYCREAVECIPDILLLLTDVWCSSHTYVRAM